jgi:hypothetical protein
MVPVTEMTPNQEATVASFPVAIPKAPIATPVAPETSHFKNVDDADRRRAAAPITAADDDGHEQGIWLSIAGLVVLLLLALVATAWWLLQPPSADKLYSQIVAARDAEDLESSRSRIEKFMQLYPQDARGREIQDLLAALDVDLTIRRLQHQARRAGGIQQLDPVRMTLMEALQLQELQPQSAEERLRLWLNVFGDRAEGDRQLRPLLAVAQSVLREVERAAEEPPEERLTELTRCLDDAERELAGEERKAYLRDFIALFANKEWARSHVARAQELLAK